MIANSIQKEYANTENQCELPALSHLALEQYQATPTTIPGPEHARINHRRIWEYLPLDPGDELRVILHSLDLKDLLALVVLMKNHFWNRGSTLH